MKPRADVVIIGAGIVGSSAAHFLTLAGVQNVVVVDQGPLDNTGGSSFHAPGLVFQTHGSRLMCTLAQWSTELYRSARRPRGPELARGRVGRGRDHAGSRRRARAAPQLRDVLRPRGRDHIARSRPRAWCRCSIPPRSSRPTTSSPTGSRAPATSAGSCVAPPSRAARSSTASRASPASRSRAAACAASRRPTGPIATSTLLVCAGIWGPEMQGLDRSSDPDAADAAPVRLDEPAARARRRDARGRARDPAPPGSRRLLPPARRAVRHRQLRRTIRCRSTCPS